MHAPSKDRLPLGGTIPAECAPAHLPTAPGARPATHWRGEAIDDEPIARGDHLPQHVRNPDHPIGELMQTTIEARDADPLPGRVIRRRTPVRAIPFVDDTKGCRTGTEIGSLKTAGRSLGKGIILILNNIDECGTSIFPTLTTLLALELEVSESS